MNELTVLLYVVATIAVSYLYIYPKYAGNSIRMLQWNDFFISLIPLSISATLFWVSDPSFRFIFFDTNWFLFTLLTHFVLELPFFILYLKARGLWSEYVKSLKLNPGDSGWSTASAEAVEKQLSDSKWNGLRTVGAKRFLLIGSNISIIAGTAALWFAQDNIWASLSLLHIMVVGIFYFLLRKSVRLVADAPDEALDERLAQLRDRSHLIAYRYLSFIATASVTCLMIYAAVQDFGSEGDGFNYQIQITWTQIQAIFWFVLGYALLLPSMCLIAQGLKGSREWRKK